MASEKCGALGPDVIVLAGGLGARLQGAGGDGPKPMAPICGRPFLEYVLDHLALAGARRIVLSVCHRWERIREHFGFAYAGMGLDYSVEESPLGTGGAIAQAWNQLRTDRPLIVNGDTLFRVDVREFFAGAVEETAPIVMALKRLPDAGRYGSVTLTAAGVTGLVEKGHSGPGLINGGMYVLSPAARTLFPARSAFSFEKDVLEPAAPAGKIAAYVSDGYFIDIGVPEDYDRAQQDLAPSYGDPR